MLQLQISKILNSFALDIFGWTPLQQPITISLYKDWIDSKKNGSMNYLVDHYEKKKNPNNLSLDSRKANSAIVIGVKYAPVHPAPFTVEQNKLSHLNTALYSRGQDYHFWLKELLNQLINKLRLEFPDEDFVSWTDSGPVLERDLALRAGLGWIGKNTCLINKNEGSLFLLGEVFTTLNLENNNPLSGNFCGDCDICIKACPTQALDQNYHLDATKCISYWTIESKETPNEQLRSQFGDLIFGCDICQLVCPWNKKKLLNALDQSRNSTPNNVNNYREKQIEELKWILTSSNKTLQKTLAHTAYSRSAGLKLKRNALIVIGNLKIKELTSTVKQFLGHNELDTLAKWTIKLLSDNP